MTYTLGADPLIEQYIHDQLNIAVKIILQHLKEPPIGIILCGGFGRGEGTVINNGHKVKPVNDYDFLIVSNKIQIDAKKLGNQIANVLGMELVDVGIISPDKLSQLPISQWAYDLKYGSRVIFGDQNLLQLIPEFSPERIPIWEAIKLLCNRMAGILGSLRYNEESRFLAIENLRWFRVQIDHMLIACGDASLMLSSNYHHLYQERLKRLFICINWLEESELKMIAEAYKRKLRVWESNQLAEHNIEAELSSVEVLAKKVYLRVIECYLDRNVPNLVQAIKFYYKSHWFSLPQYLKRFIGVMLQLKRYHRLNFLPAAPIHICYTMVPLIFFSGPWAPIEQQSILFKSFRRFLCWTSDSRKLTWDQARNMVYSFWELHCH